MRRPKRHHYVLVLLACLASVLAFPNTAAAQGFNEEFSSPVLDAAWTVVPGMRIASGFPPPANEYSLTANPGHLRYSLNPMTHFDGFLNNYQPTFGYHSCCVHDPGLELLRAFGGDHWTLESKVGYHMPFANGRSLELRVYFGDGGAGTFYAAFQRTRDVHPFNGLCSNLSQRGPSLPNGGFVRILLESPPCAMLPGFDGTDTTHYLRLDRDGGVLTAMLSDDGVNWSTVWSHDLGTQLDGLDQRVVIAGLSWFVPAGSFADYDYVRVTEVGPGPPANLTLAPETDTNEAGTEHCVTATVTDASGDPTPGMTVRFSVAGANSASGSATTDANGQATFCYTGTVAGMDTISAFADTDGDGTQDAGEPGDTAAKTWTAGPPATLTLSPKAATNPVDSEHCVTATVEDAFGNPVPGVTVRFTVAGSDSASGSATTDASGQATFCYTVSALPGADAIHAFADTDGDAAQDAGEPFDDATKLIVLPPSTPGCTVSNGGRITAANGDKATFGGSATFDGLVVSGDEQYVDHGPAANLTVHSTAVLAVVCTPDRTQATIFGQATINGSGTHDYRIDVKDLNEPGRNDTYRILLSTGYDSGEQTLTSGNVQIH